MRGWPADRLCSAADQVRRWHRASLTRAVVNKAKREARSTELNKTTQVEQALEPLTSKAADQAARMAALLAQLDHLPDRADASDPLEWDERGLPSGFAAAHPPSW